jgi:hypothetical protein
MALFTGERENFIMSTKTKTKTKRKKTADKKTVFHTPSSVEPVDYQTMEENLPDTSLSFDHLTTQAEALSELVRASDRFQALQRQLAKEQEYGIALGQFTERNWGPIIPFTEPVQRSGDEKIDGRTIQNPKKNLKISAVRSFGWAKSQGKTADEAKARVLEVVEKKARAKFSMSEVPIEVLDYIEEEYRNYTPKRTSVRRSTISQNSRISLGSGETQALIVETPEQVPAEEYLENIEVSGAEPVVAE